MLQGLRCFSTGAMEESILRIWWQRWVHSNTMPCIFCFIVRNHDFNFSLHWIYLL
jgi:hypothetical protein